MRVPLTVGGSAKTVQGYETMKQSDAEAAAAVAKVMRFTRVIKRLEAQLKEARFELSLAEREIEAANADQRAAEVTTELRSIFA